MTREEKTFEIIEPRRQRSAFIFASPHSGRYYPADFLANSKLDEQSIRQSEDPFVDELIEASPRYGAPLIKALYPRAYLDVNREPYELDPAMFGDTLPHFANTSSPRVRAGLGTIAKNVAHGQPIYKQRLQFKEAKQRIDRIYMPYHKALRQLMQNTAHKFGHAILIDCHSMPILRQLHQTKIDIILGDCFGRSCQAPLTDFVHNWFENTGLNVVRNRPYAGGYITKTYGKPDLGIQTLQIEICRSLYWNETDMRKSVDFKKIQQLMTCLIAELTKYAAYFAPLPQMAAE